MSNRNNNNNQKKHERPLQETLHEQAALRLKAFIEDIRRDPMFSHRLFYPVLYKEIIRRNPEWKNNKISAPVAEVIYQYYLLKMEKFSSDTAAQVFQAILLANGPMLPTAYRYRITDADDANSLLNLRNRNEVIHRTKVLLHVLQDDNLFNFIFRSTVGGNLENMRQRFYELVNNPNRRNVNIELSRPISTRTEENITFLRDYFEQIRDRDIEDVVNFLIYMGKTRNIVTDFSYKPISQDLLDRYTSYSLSEEDEKKLEFMSQIEQALDTNILQKDIVSQMDYFIPIITRVYAAICGGQERGIELLRNFNQTINLPPHLRNALRTKLQRTLKQIADYTRNYLTKELLKDPEQVNSDKFISRILRYFYDNVDRGRSISDLSREIIQYQYFYNEKPDLHRLIYELFKNDVEYVLEICTQSIHPTRYARHSLQYAWDRSHLGREEIVLDNLKDQITRILSSLIDCFRNNRSIEQVDSIIENLYRNYAQMYPSDQINNREVLERAENSIENELSHLIDQLEHELLFKEYSNDTVFERVATSVFNKITDMIKGSAKRIFSQINNMKTRAFDTIAIKLMWRKIAHRLLYSYLNGYLNSVRTANDFNKTLQTLVIIDIIARIGGFINKEFPLEKHDIAILKNAKVPGTKVSELVTLTQPSIDLIVKIVRDFNNCIRIASRLQERISKYRNLSEEEYIRILSGVSDEAQAEQHRINTDHFALELTNIYFEYFLKPLLINFFGYAFDNFIYSARRNEIEADVISKDVLHFSQLLTPRNVGILTFDGPVVQDLAKLSYILLSDTYHGISYGSPDSIVQFLDEIYGIKYFNVFIFGRSDAYVYLNNIGIPYLYRGAKTKIPIRELRKNYEFLMDPTRGLYKNISLPKKKH